MYAPSHNLSLWKLKRAETAKCTFYVLAPTISVAYVMSACVQTHVLRDTTHYVTTCLMIHQEMALKGLRMEKGDQGLALEGHDKGNLDEAAL